MTVTRAQFRDLLGQDEAQAFPFEFIDAHERVSRRLAPPATNLGSGRGRFWELLSRIEPLVASNASIIDFGAYPGTLLRLIRSLPQGERARLAAAGFSFSHEFECALGQLGIRLVEMEFDARRGPNGAESHILTRAVDELFDVAVCTEVIEHQFQPLVLCAGMNRFLADGGKLLLTTNSAGFIGDVLKLVSGRHNVESLERSHVLADHEWRPHIRLYTLPEIRKILELCGFEVEEGFYFDNGSVYRGAKGTAMSALRRAAGMVPHMRSHLWVKARKIGDPTHDACERIQRTCELYGVSTGALSALGA